MPGQKEKAEKEEAEKKEGEGLTVGDFPGNTRILRVGFGCCFCC